MTDVTLEMLASQIHVTVDLLVRKFADAGMDKSPVDFVSQQEKEALLLYLNNNYVNATDRLTLQRKIHSILNIPSSSGKRKQVKVEVRKKRVYFGSKSAVKEKLDAVSVTSSKNDLSNVIFDDGNIFLDDKLSTVLESDQVCHIGNLCKGTLRKLGDDTVTASNIKNEFHHEKVNKGSTSKDVKGLKNVLKDDNIDLSLIGSTYSVACVNDNTEFDSLQSDNQDNLNNDKLRFHHINKSIENNKDNRKFENDKYSRNKVRCKSKYRTKLRNCKMLKKKKGYHLLEFQEDVIDNEYIKPVFRVDKTQQYKNNNVLIQKFNKPSCTVNRDVVIGEKITISELANKMAIKVSEVIKVMVHLGFTVTMDYVLDQDTAHLIAEEMGHNVVLHRENEVEEFILNDRDITEFSSLKLRPPIVTVMGHVDHGKTSLLDYIRSSRLVSSEQGGITQRIGAYYVETKKGIITFIDTPGHEAFTSMRSRGSKITDIVVLVIAADDGVMLQTVEAIQHAKAANVPIVVAINKVDKSTSNPDKIKSDLLKYGLVSEDFGGNNQFICISAKTGFGIDNLLDAILLQAEILELKSFYDCMASGFVIESFIDKGRGPVASILVREGTLRRGDIVLCGFEYGKIRAIRNHLGHDVLFAGPSMPVEIFGLSGALVSGDLLTVVRDEKKAKEVALYRQKKFRNDNLSMSKDTFNVDHVLSSMNNERGCCLLNLVLKTDTHGSAEAIVNSLRVLSTDKVKIKVICSSVGDVTESDVILASTVDAILIGFNVRLNNAVRQFIKREAIDYRYYFVIYSLIDDIKLLLSNLLKPKCKENILGHAEVRNVFRSVKSSTVVGCMMIDGCIKRNNKIRILRNDSVVYEGELESLRRFKNDINEVRYGMECGIIVKNYTDLCIGDVIEVFEKVILKDMQ